MKDDHVYDGKDLDGPRAPLPPPSAFRRGARGAAPGQNTGLVSSVISRQKQNIRIVRCDFDKLDNLYEFACKIKKFELGLERRGNVIVTPNGIKAKRSGLHGHPFISHEMERGIIKGFSTSSKRRMKDFLMSMDWEVLKASYKRAHSSRGVFATLTYPDSYSNDWQTWKTHLDAFRKRLLRSWGENVSVIWKLENQEKRCKKYGVKFIPHFHLVIDFKQIADINTFRRWLSYVWYEIVGSNDKNHLKAGTNVRAVYGSTGKLFSYLSKYMSKTFKTEVHTGRVWGIWNSFEKCPETLYQDVDWATFLRRVRGWGKFSRCYRNLRGAYGVRIFGENLGQLLRSDLPGGHI